MLHKILTATGVGAGAGFLGTGWIQWQKNREAFKKLPREEQKKIYDNSPENKFGSYVDIQSVLIGRSTIDPLSHKHIAPRIPFEEAYPEPDTSKPIAPQSEADSNKLNSQQLLSSFISGSVAGATVAYTLFPWEAFKKYSQRRDISLSHLTKYDVMSAHFKAEPFHPFRGSAVFAINIVPTTAVQLTTDAILKAYLPADSSASTLAASAALCGVTGALTATPVENFVARMQTMNATSTVKVGSMSVIHDMFHQSAFRPWRSYPMIAARDGIFTFCMLYAAPEASKKAQEIFGESRSADMAARFGVSVLGATVSHIPDTIGTKMQSTNDTAKIFKTAKSIYASHGAKGFLHGLPPRLLLFFSFSNAIPYVQKATDPYAKDIARRVIG